VTQRLRMVVFDAGEGISRRDHRGQAIVGHNKYHGRVKDSQKLNEGGLKPVNHVVDPR
jgi:hypothetical protein